MMLTKGDYKTQTKNCIIKFRKYIPSISNRIQNTSTSRSNTPTLRIMDMLILRNVSSMANENLRLTNMLRSVERIAIT